jgi:hypothetical protein
MISGIDGYDITITQTDITWISNLSEIPKNSRFISFSIDYENPTNLKMGSINKSIVYTGSDKEMKEEAQRLEDVYLILASRWKSDFINELNANLPEDINVPLVGTIYFWWNDEVECVQYGYTQIKVPANSGSISANNVAIALLTIYLMMTSVHTVLMPVIKSVITKYINIMAND